MHQNRFLLGSLQRSPDPLAGFKGPYFKGRGGKGKEEGREGEETYPQNKILVPPLIIRPKQNSVIQYDYDPS